MYSFELTYGATTTVLTPNYKDVKIVTSQESDEQYYKAEMQGVIKLIDTDFDILVAQPFDTEFLLNVKEDETSLIEVVFFKTHCKWDEDNKIVTLAWETNDAYRAIKKVMEKEQDIIKAAPELAPVWIKRRPIIQAYILGDSVLTCFQTGTYWEVESEAITDAGVLTGTYKFALSKSYGYVDAEPTIKGYYDTGTGIREDGLYALELRVIDVFQYKIAIMRVSDSVDLYETAIENNSYFWGRSFTEISGTGTATSERKDVYTRFYLDLEDTGSNPTIAIPDPDIIARTSSYRYVKAFAIESYTASDEVQTDPTEFGKVPDYGYNAGKYFVQPDPATYSIGEPAPLSRHNWGTFSVWFHFLPGFWTIDEDNTREIQINDAYYLHSIINNLLTGTGLTHNETCSEFLYDVNPITSVELARIIIPKSNLLIGEYDQAATRATLTLRDILSFLKMAYRVYYYADGTKLKLEHISWFNKGGSYTTPAVIGIDLTTALARNGKPWGLHTNQYEFDKANMPQRIECSWMDNTSKFFTGYPVEILSGYVEVGRVDKREINMVTPDIDFVISNPADVSLDGFIVLDAIDNGSGEWVTPLVDLSVGANDLTLQNGYMAFVYLHDQFYRDDMPAKSVKINEATETMTTVTKNKVQEKVLFPYVSMTPYKLVKTGLGNGKIQKIELDLETRMYKTDLAYDTE